jgi:hypothetical protein
MYFRAFYTLELPISESNCLLEDIEIPFESKFGEALFQIQTSTLSNIEGDLFSCIATIKCCFDKGIVSTFERLRSNVVPNLNPFELVNEFGDFDDDIERMTGIKSLPQLGSIGSYSWIEDSFWHYVLEVKSLLDKYSIWLVDLICWRCGLMGRRPVSSSELLSFLWSLNAEDWFQLPLVGVGKDPYQFETELTESSFADIQDYLKNFVEVPLGLKIFHQAWSMRETYPQVALVMAISAAEVEIKRFIARYEPQRHNELTLFKILESLRNSLVLNGNSFIFPDTLIDSLDKARILRNKVIHSGEESIDLEELELTLISIRNFLCLLDLFQGHKWSANFLSSQLHN